MEDAADRAAYRRRRTGTFGPARLRVTAVRLRGGLRAPRRELLQRPLRAQQRAAVGAAPDGHVLAGARVDREVALDRIPLVVLRDQIVEGGVEAPAAHP